MTNKKIKVFFKKLLAVGTGTDYSKVE